MRGLFPSRLYRDLSSIFDISLISSRFIYITLHTMPKTGGKARDACWNEMTLVPSSTGKQHPRVYCKHCNSQWTSNERAIVQRHLAVCFGLPEALWYRYQPSRIETREPPKAELKRQVNNSIDCMGTAELTSAVDACARWIYSTGLPLSTVDHPAFHAFIKQLRPSFKPPTRWTLSESLLSRHYDSLKKEVDYAIQQARHITIITDG